MASGSRTVQLPEGNGTAPAYYGQFPVDDFPNTLFRGSGIYQRPAIVDFPPQGK